MIRRCLGLAGLLTLTVLLLCGCLINTPTNAAKRFFKSVSNLDWEKMEKLVDWPSTERALGRPIGDRKEVLILVAEHIGAQDIHSQGEDRAKGQYLFLRISKIETLNKTSDEVRFRLTVRLDEAHSHEVEIHTRKIGRTWRVVLTPNLIKSKYIRN